MPAKAALDQARFSRNLTPILPSSQLHTSPI